MLNIVWIIIRVTFGSEIILRVYNMYPWLRATKVRNFPDFCGCLEELLAYWPAIDAL